MSNKTITIEALVAAPPAKVWECWTAPEHITQWNFASDDWCCPHAHSDLRVGGKYLARMEAKDGSVGFDFEARFDTVEPGQALAYTMTDGRRAITHFSEEGEATRISTEFDPESTNPIQMQRDGWQAILDNFKHYVESIT